MTEWLSEEAIRMAGLFRVLCVACGSPLSFVHCDLCAGDYRGAHPHMQCRSCAGAGIVCIFAKVPSKGDA